MRVKLLVEGGGDGKRKPVNRECRKGFRLFLENAGLTGRMPEITACGGRRKAYDKFAREHGKGDDDLVVLLVDAEGPVPSSLTPWEHLKARDDWGRPAGARDDQCHLMTQVMESWFLADLQTIRGYYGPNFQESAIPKRPNVEDAPKQDVLDGLDKAARRTAKRGYDKGKHSFEILARLEPGKVQQSAPSAKRFIEDMKRFCAP